MDQYMKHAIEEASKGQRDLGSALTYLADSVLELARVIDTQDVHLIRGFEQALESKGYELTE